MRRRKQGKTENITPKKSIKEQLVYCYNKYKKNGTIKELEKIIQEKLEKN